MLGDLAQGVDLRVAGLQVGVDHQRAPRVQPGGGAEFPVGLRAHGYQQQVAVQDQAALGAHAADARGAGVAGHAVIEHQPHAAFDQGVAQHLAAGGVELPAEQQGPVLQHGDRRHLPGQRGGQLQPEQPAADDQHPRVGGHQRHRRVRILPVAQGHHALTCHRQVGQAAGAAAGGQHQPVVTVLLPGRRPARICGRGRWR